MPQRKRKRRVKAASGRAQPRQLSTRLVSGDRIWARPSGAQRPKKVNDTTEVERTQGGVTTVRTKSAPKRMKPFISRKRSKGGPR